MMELVKKPLPKSLPQEAPALCLRERSLPVGSRTFLMGILNTTPDSFSDGGKFLKPQDALQKLEVLTASGADVIDLGGESTRPGAPAVTAEEEIRRVRPVLEAWGRSKREALLSIDTAKSEVAELALQNGASLVNDVTALRGDPRMAEVVARYQAGVVLMHMRGTPRTMQENPVYEDVIAEINRFFEVSVRKALKAGIRETAILLDPGIGFGKTLPHNLEILRNLRSFRSHGRPLLVGPSRKSFIGEVLRLPVERRLLGTAVAVTVSVLNGADMVRVHDLPEMKEVVQMADAMREDGWRESV